MALNQDDLIRRAVIKQLICNFSLSFVTIEQAFGIQFEQYFADDIALLTPFIEDGLVSINSETIQVEAKGMLLIRNICMCFDLYLRQRARQQQFSRVI